MAKQESLWKLIKIRRDVECALSDLNHHIRQAIEGETQLKINKEHHKQNKTYSKPKLPMTSDEYRALEEACCPYCGSVQIEGDSVHIGRATAWQPIVCLSCEKRWNDIYTLIAYEPVE